jgi:hypothetical protein
MAALRPDRKNTAPTAQTGGADTAMSESEQDWMERAKSAYYSSTSFLDANYRKGWDDSIRAFNNQHSADSKYSQPAYDKRSKVFRPKIRTVIRKNEAAGAAAFFSNMDTITVNPDDQSNKTEVASAEVMKQVVQYRLTKSIPWFQIVLGGLQDAQTTGVACAEVLWEYKEAKAGDTKEATEEAEPESEEYPDQPEMPPNAMMASSTGALSPQNPMPPGSLASAMPPGGQPPVQGVPPPTMGSMPQVGGAPPVAAMAPPPPTKPAGPKVLVDKPVIDLFPVENLRIDPGANWIDPVNSSPYVIRLLPMYVLDIKAKMDAGLWRPMSDAVISSATEDRADSTRIARQKDRDDPYGADARSVDDYEIVWVQRHIHRRDDEDWEFYTLSDMALLTEPRPLKETVFHGKRPYVMGCCVLETHKVMPNSIATLGKGLQDETNEIANQRMDNIKFVLNKKWFVKRGKEADVAGLLRNVPGGVVMLDNPTEEMDELLGNFNPAQLMVNGGASNPARNMALLGQSQAAQVEYLLRTYVETFIQPILRLLVLCIQHYETDTTVLGIAGKRANLLQTFGINEATDVMLQNEMTLTVNVGMGATDPMMKLNKFLSVMHSYTEMLKSAPPGINMQEAGKEMFGLMGYQDGSRFLSNDNPQMQALQAELQKQQAMIAQLNAKLTDQTTVHQVKLKATAMTNDTRLKAVEMGNQNKIQTTQIKEDALNKRSLATHWRALHEHTASREDKHADRVVNATQNKDLQLPLSQGMSTQ